MQEKKFSSPLLFIDILIQTLQIETAVCIVSVIMYQFELKMLASYGLWNIWMIHVCRFCFKNPGDGIQIPCLPYIIKKKYCPALIYLLFVLLFGEGLSFLIATVLGHLQSIYFKGCFFRIRLRWLKLLESITPKCIKERHDYYSL
jgi:hypothetical protein